MVAFDRSGDGGELRIVTDPNEIRSIEIEEQERKRNVSYFHCSDNVNHSINYLYTKIQMITT